MIPCMLPEFRQSVPVDPDELELMEGHNRTGCLRYRDPRTGETCTVPNVPYNQRSDMCIGGAEFRLAQARRNLAALYNNIRRPREYEVRKAQQSVQSAERAIERIQMKIAVSQGKAPKEALLYSAGEVALHIAKSWHRQKGSDPRVRAAWIEKELRASHYHLKRVPVKSIPGYDYDVCDPLLASRYAGLSTEAPAIVLATQAEISGEGTVLVDGHHRLRAAYERGDEDILAYVPVEEKKQGSTPAGFDDRSGIPGSIDEYLSRF